MPATNKQFALVFFLAWLAAPSPAKSTEELNWKAEGFAQVQALRDDTSLPGLAGPLDSDGNGPQGEFDGAVLLRRLEVKITGPLGFAPLTAVAGTSVQADSAGLTDVYLSWAVPGLLELKAGRWRLPFGRDLQASSGNLLGTQRLFMYGFDNFGMSRPWGLQMLAERAWGLRLDATPSGQDPVRFIGQAGLGQAQAQDFSPALSGMGRSGLALEAGLFKAEAAYSIFASRANLSLPSASYLPLGASFNDQASWETGSTAGGKQTVMTWGPDGKIQVGWIGLEGEMACQSLGEGLSQGGGAWSAWVEYPFYRDLKPIKIWVRSEQAFTGFPDGLHRANSLYRVRSYGLQFPMYYHLSLKLERLETTGDDFPTGFYGGQVMMSQLQVDF